MPLNSNAHHPTQKSWDTTEGQGEDLSAHADETKLKTQSRNVTNLVRFTVPISTLSVFSQQFRMDQVDTPHHQQERK